MKIYCLIIKKLNSIYFHIYKYMDYYRKPINKVINDVKLKMQLGALTLKLNENNNKIDDLIGFDKNIKNDISTNTGKIGNNKSDILTNSSLIITNTGAISTNLEKIDDNINAIKLINKNSQDNSKDISTNSDLISTNTKSISTNLEKIDNFTQYILQSGKDFEEKYTIEKQIFKFDKNKHFYTLFEKEIEFDFTKNSLLFIKNNMYYKYDNLSNDYHRLQHEYNIYDGDNLIHKYLFNKDTYYDESIDPILHTNEDFCICFKKNYDKIKINLQLHRHNRHGAGNINLEIDDDNESYINIDYVDRNNDERIDINKKDISTNLIKINSNEDNIASNLNEINYLKKNKHTQYLKNVYNILFYNNNEQISFKDQVFYEKIFELNANKNDFLEMSFKIELEYRNINDRNYVKNIYQILDGDDNSLYIKTISNNDYSYYSNKIFIDENIFYNFNKDIKKIKFVIKFQKLSASRAIYLYYMKNLNYRFILKHYST